MREGPMVKEKGEDRKEEEIKKESEEKEEKKVREGNYGRGSMRKEGE